MRVMIAGAALALIVSGAAAAQGTHYVRGYYRSDGTYVQPHMQTNPDGNPYNNWSTQGNVNPYTGEPGYKTPRPSYGYTAPTYGYSAPSYTPAPVPSPYGRSNTTVHQKYCNMYGCY